MADKVDRELIRALAALLTENNLTEIEWAEGERRIRVVRSAGPSVVAMPAAMAAPAAAVAAAEERDGLVADAPPERPGAQLLGRCRGVPLVPEKCRHGGVSLVPVVACLCCSSMLRVNVADLLRLDARCLDEPGHGGNVFLHLGRQMFRTSFARH